MGLLAILGDCARVDRVDFRAVRGTNIKRRVRLRADASQDDCGPPVKGGAAFLPAGVDLRATVLVTGTDASFPMLAVASVTGNASTPAVVTLSVRFSELEACFADGALQEFQYLVTEVLPIGGERLVLRGTVTVEDSAYRGQP